MLVPAVFFLSLSSKQRCLIHVSVPIFEPDVCISMAMLTYASFWRLHMDRYGRQPRRSHTKQPLQFLQRKWNSNRHFLCPINFTAFAISMDPFPRPFKKERESAARVLILVKQSNCRVFRGKLLWVCDCSKSDKELAVKCVICNNSWITRTIRICHRFGPGGAADPWSDTPA